MRASSIAWYLRRPALLPELYRRGLRHFKANFTGATHREVEAERANAAAWCAERAVDLTTALSRLANLEAFIPLTELEPGVLAEARDWVEAADIEMDGPANLDLLFHLARSVGARHVIETGVAWGWSSLALLLALRENPDAMLVSVDMPQPGIDDAQMIGIAVPPHLRTQWRLLRRADREGIGMAIKALGGQVDLVHYDSDMTRAGRDWAYPRLWQALREGGVFISDDVGDDLAFRDFSRELEVRPIIVRDHSNDVRKSTCRYVGVMVKP